MELLSSSITSKESVCKPKLCSDKLLERRSSPFSSLTRLIEVFLNSKSMERPCIKTSRELLKMPMLSSLPMKLMIWEKDNKLTPLRELLLLDLLSSDGPSPLPDLPDFTQRNSRSALTRWWKNFGEITTLMPKQRNGRLMKWVMKELNSEDASSNSSWSQSSDCAETLWMETKKLSWRCSPPSKST